MDSETLKKVGNLNNDNFPVFPQKEIEEMAGRYFAAKDAYLELHRRYGRPLYVFEKEVFRSRLNEFRAAFEMCIEDASFYFALKCNNHPLVLGAAIENGYGVDVSSGLELGMALEGGASDIVFSGPGKTDAEIRLAFENCDKTTILADSFGEIERIGAISESFDKRMRVGMRLTTNPDGLWRKFGIPLERLPELWETVKAKPNLQLCGLQFHNSWSLSPTTQVEFIKRLGAALKNMPSGFKDSVRFLDVGGGYWPPQGEWLTHAATPLGRLEELAGASHEDTKMLHYRCPSAPITQFAAQIGAALKEHVFSVLKCKICFEPGRWVCNDAVHLLMSVVDKKDERMAITDAGTNAVGWERFEHDYFPVLNLSRPALEERRCDVLGSLCTPHDVWGRSFWGGGIEEGDVLMIPMQGAYTYSLRQNFIKPLPEFVAVP